jgi:hypothetical protein
MGPQAGLAKTAAGLPLHDVRLNLVGHGDDPEEILMAKQVFVAGGLTAEDFSYAKLVVALAVSNSSVSGLLPDPPPNEIVDEQ